MSERSRIDPIEPCTHASQFSAQQLNTYCFMPQAAPASETSLQIAAVPVFLSAADYEQMRQLINALETVIRSAEWRRLVLPAAPDIARHDPGNAGVLYGFDFHLTESGPKLIEINTNAGGALIITDVLRTQSGCCSALSAPNPAEQARLAENAIIESLITDFFMVKGRAPGLIAIVDAHPEQQYLYPEFQRFASLLRERDVAVEICDPADLRFSSGVLSIRNKAVDMVYNRLTDFYFSDSTVLALREAYLSGNLVVSPNPFHHALYADKRNLALLTNPQTLTQMNVAPALQKRLLEGIPETHCVDRENAAQLWADRKHYFFKPASAYGGKGA
ncbi:MAG TPA: hypothetical protein VFM46_14565, partial [Pseudomonadales bacterium]|nr:hypothetical protein [Pseudomonadales bacterium]